MGTERAVSEPVTVARAAAGSMLARLESAIAEQARIGAALLGELRTMGDPTAAAAQASAATETARADAAAARAAAELTAAHAQLEQARAEAGHAQAEASAAHARAITAETQLTQLTQATRRGRERDR